MMIKLILMAAVVLVLAVVVLFAVAAIRRSANRGANRVPMLKKDDWSATIYSCAESRSEL